MGRLFVITLEGNLYSCKYCKTHFALSDDIISKSFHCKYGSAYLFNKVVNVTVGDKEDRVMMTGIHTVVDVFCVGCGSLVGWKYVRLFFLRTDVLNDQMHLPLIYFS
ncbi:yippee-like [Olea europaea subsp. europaea]|uniref:Protein yippee-like n=1 Tax=Olea europaea subsp. europaea TaxID=158383 RepID=A0A8S0TVP1_OLEEU|nr:yippee-like [Olea europaea subsp. europaea]